MIDPLAHVAPGSVSVGSLDGDGEWTTLGTLAEPFDPFPAEDLGSRSLTFTVPPPTTYTFAAQQLDNLAAAAENMRQAFALMFEYDAPYAGPIAPRKRKGLTGKAYRQARRRYHRARVRWERAGRPDTTQVRVYMPRVHIDPAP